MIGKHRVIVKSKNVNYDFTLNRNITILCGDSATGKTTLLDLISAYNKFSTTSGVTLQCDKECAVLEGETIPKFIEQYKDTIIFIDEHSHFIFTKEFSDIVKRSNNYWVFVTRYPIKTLPYSYTEIYGIRKSGKYVSADVVYNEFYRINEDQHSSEMPERMVTEELNA